MILVTTKIDITSSHILLNSDDVIDPSVISKVNETGVCDFSVSYNGIEYTGDIIRSNDSLIINFDDNTVVFPAGICLVIDCSVNETVEKGCVNEHNTLNVDTKLATLDENGCVSGYITVQQIIDVVKDTGIKTLCEVLGVQHLTMGSITASDRILVSDDQCNVKTVSISEIICAHDDQ